jgi:hypothetical protein
MCNISTNSTIAIALSVCSGGIVGWAETGVIISSCYNKGSITSSTTQTADVHAGGILGQAEENTIKINNCYNSGTVDAYSSGSGSPYKGGIIGRGSGVITNCYNTGTVTNAIRGSSGSTTNCYYLSGSGSGLYGGIAQTAEFMQSPDFVSLLNNGPIPNSAYAFDIEMINEGFAIHKWQAPPPVLPIITTTTLIDGAEGTAYNQQLTAIGTVPITWSLASGSLPNGLTLSATGLISGTPTTASTSNFTVKATNSAGNDTQALSITINGVAPVITTTVLQDGIVSTTYNQQLAATGTAPITWSLESGSLPTGLAVSTT